MSQEPYKLLTLVIPTYNMEKYLTKCLESVTAPLYTSDIGGHCCK